MFTSMTARVSTNTYCLALSPADLKPEISRAVPEDAGKLKLYYSNLSNHLATIYWQNQQELVN